MVSVCMHPTDVDVTEFWTTPDLVFAAYILHQHQHKHKQKMPFEAHFSAILRLRLFVGARVFREKERKGGENVFIEFRN